MLKLRRKREGLGLSRAEVARRSRISPTEYGRIESGMVRPYPVWAVRIAEAIGHNAECAQELFVEEDTDGD
ncbi:MAG: helix-turn-helix transcriptional regulator [Coriobacteriia bacterium]|nr:helix-turn-helix transcriptional regulator [Coriobacteriia bacterium]